MQTVISLTEAAQLELQGAQKRLQRAHAELEFFVSVHGDTDPRQLHALQVEVDEATRLVAHAREEYVQWEHGGQSR